MKYTVLISLLFWVFDGIKAQSVREVDIWWYIRGCHCGIYG